MADPVLCCTNDAQMRGGNVESAQVYYVKPDVTTKVFHFENSENIARVR